jgi:hypothetical protein
MVTGLLFCARTKTVWARGAVEVGSGSNSFVGNLCYGSGHAKKRSGLENNILTYLLLANSISWT